MRRPPLADPYRVRRASPIGEPGTLLGAFDDIDIHPISVTLAPGDVVVFYTDGATDVPPPHDLDDDAMDEPRRQAAQPGGTADDIANRIQQSLETILPFNYRNDDIALLVLAVPAGCQARSVRVMARAPRVEIPRRRRTLQTP